VNEEANMKDIILAGTLMAAALGVFTPDASAQTRTITIPSETTVVEVESTHCEPVYNEATGTLYVPRCWKLMQREPEPNALERLIGRTVRGTATEVENSVGNGIDRRIYELGKKIDEALGTY
jgi:hypothetical protein